MLRERLIVVRSALSYAWTARRDACWTVLGRNECCGVSQRRSITERAGVPLSRLRSTSARLNSAIPQPDSTPDAPLERRFVGFPIVGVGASAGGLDALEKFLSPVPALAGQAFVVVQHLDPTHPPLLVGLLQRRCALPVVEAKDGTVVLINHVYVIPPDRELSILNGVLLVLDPTEPRGHRLPIDVFLSALADDRGEGAVGVILSGMGHDGENGLRAVKSHGGLTLAQSPESSQFDSMPRGAIEAGIVDVVAPPESLYGAIQQRAKSRGDDVPTLGAFADAAATFPASSVEAINKVILLVRTKTGHDFSHYKRSTLSRRIARRMQAHHLDSLDRYVQFLQSNPDEADVLFHTLLIGVTQFFRDPAAWEHLASTAIPALLAAHPSGGTIRAWVPGCSTGEEAYSLAILFREALSRLTSSTDYTIQIFATDLDRQSIATARAATYPKSIAADVSADRLRRFFVEDSRGYRLTKAIREMVILAPQNLVMDPPFTKLDLISCRNLLIYLTPELQKRLLPLFHYGLRPHGLLFLGTAETVGPASTLFAPLVESARIYSRVETPVALNKLDFPSNFGRIVDGVRHVERDTEREAQLRGQMERAILQRAAPTALLVTGDGEILHTMGDVSRYLGDGTLLSLTSTDSPLAVALVAGLATAVSEGRSVVLDDAIVTKGTDTLRVRATVLPTHAAAPEAMSFLVMLAEVSAEPMSAPGEVARDVDALNRELARARQETLSSQQELRSTNEELQSANEELTSSKEEMQSMNEELQTVNHELQAKLDELTLASNDMTNLLNSTSIATLFLDAELNVRRYTVPTTSIIRLIPGDVGRPVTDLVSDLDFPEMVAAAQEVLRTLVVFEREVAASDGRWFVVRIMPYRTQDDRIDGLVLTFTDATKPKTLEAALRAAQHSLLERLASQGDPPADTRPNHAAP